MRSFNDNLARFYSFVVTFGTLESHLGSFPFALSEEIGDEPPVAGVKVGAWGAVMHLSPCSVSLTLVRAVRDRKERCLYL